jgi:hypothetical protein
MLIPSSIFFVVLLDWSVLGLGGRDASLGCSVPVGLPSGGLDGYSDMAKGVVARGGSVFLLDVRFGNISPFDLRFILFPFSL